MFVHFLFTPINLLFLVNALLFIYIAPYFWRLFALLRFIARFFPKIEGNKIAISILLMFLPLTLLGLIVMYCFPLSGINMNSFVPLNSSLVIKLNLVFVIAAAIILVFARELHFHKMKTFPSLLIGIILYAIILYFILVILVFSTTIICMNAFPDGTLLKHGVINPSIVYMVYFAHLLCLSIIVLLTAKQRIVVFLIYFLGQSYLYYTWFGHPIIEILHMPF